jgi:putative Mg2+ transporter-C (MgtC) family protein
LRNGGEGLVRVRRLFTLGLRRIDSADIPDTARVVVSAQVFAANRNDAAEQIVGRLILEPNISASTWQVDRMIPEA